MARIGDDLHASGPAQGTGPKILTADHGQVTLPSDAFIAHGDLARDGQDLILKADGQSLVIKGYFSAEPHPSIHSPSGAILTPDLVHSFVHHEGAIQYAADAHANDASPVGVVKEVHGHATIHHTDGSTETIIVGSAVHEGDVIETDGAGAVNIMFRDNSSFAVSHNAKLAIDEYVFDPHSDAGASNFSMLRGMFVYTSGLIGHQDPDDVHIHTPAGSIGIRGTIIAGDVDTGQVTVVEGAIVLTSNTGEETTLSSQYETAQFDTSTGHIANEGTLSGSALSTEYSSLGSVAPAFFTGLEGTGTTTPDTTTSPDGSTAAPDSPTPTTTSPTDSGHTDITTPDATTTTAASTDTGTSTDATTFDTTSTTGDTFGTDTGTFTDAGSTTFLDTSSNSTISGTTAPDAGTTASTTVSPIDTSGGSSTTAGATVPPPVGTTFGDNLPVAGGDVIGPTDQNTAVPSSAFSVLANDTDADPLDTLTVTAGAFAGSNGGTFTLDSAGHVSFNPGSAFISLGVGASITTSYNYTVTDSQNGQSQGTVSIMVTGLNDAPTTINVSQIVGQNGTLPGNMLASDSDPDTGDTLTVTTVNGLAGNVGLAVAGTGGGLFTLQANGTYLFDTNGAFTSLGVGQSTTTSFTYTIADNHGLAAGSAETVTVTVNGVNDGPSAVNDTVLTNALLGISQNANIVSAVNVLSNDTDPDSGDVLSVTPIVSAAGSSGGLFSIDAAGNLTFASNNDFNSLGAGIQTTTSINYTISDGHGGSATATATITVTGIDDAPTVATTTPTITQGAGLILTAAMFNVVDPDTAPSNITFTFGGSAHGNVFLAGSGMLTGGGTFTLQDVISGNVKYVNDGTPAIPADTILLTVGDQTTTGITADLNLNITPVVPLNLNLAGSNHFTIFDNNDEGFGSSLTIMHDASGFDDLLIVKNHNASIGGGAFFEIDGGAAIPGTISVAGLLPADIINAQLPGVSASSHDNMVIADIGAFGMTNAPLYIVGSQWSDSIPTISQSGDVNIVDGSGTIVETISGLASTFEGFGASVAGIGDINGDGYNDVLIGAPGLSGFPAQQGNAYVLFGGHVGDATGLPPALDLSSLSVTDGYVLNGSSGTAAFGTNVSGAGDFNNDGKADFMVSSPGTNEVDLYMGTGPALTFSLAGANGNGVPLLKLGDVNGDGQSDIGIVADNKIYVFNGGGGLTGITTPVSVSSANFTVTSSGTIASGGAIGDFNGDGKSDLGVIVTNGTTADIYVVYGGTLTGGVTVNDTWLNNPHNAFHMTLSEATIADLNGMYITSAGDINGDGLGDLAIAMPNLDNAGSPAGDGSVVVVYGQATGTVNFVTGTNATANAGSESLIGTSGNDTLSDGTFGTISFTAGAGNDTIDVNTNAFTSINGGSGNDKISFLGSGNLDFTSLKSEQISHVEGIDMSKAGGGQSLTLSMNNIFELMESSDTGTFSISGTGGPASDVLNIQTGSAAGGLNATALDSALGATHTTTASTTDFHFGNYTLSIDTNLITNAHVNTV